MTRKIFSPVVTEKQNVIKKTMQYDIYLNDGKVESYSASNIGQSVHNYFAVLNSFLIHKQNPFPYKDVYIGINSHHA